MTDRLGEEIDAHDFVIRFNGAPTEGYETVVGTKTSLRFLNTQAMGAVLLRCDAAGTCRLNASCCPREHAVLLNSNSPSVTACYQSVCSSGIPRQSTPLDASAFVERTKRRGFNTMSGVYGAAAALMLCSGRVTLFGFTATASRRHETGTSRPFLTRSFGTDQASFHYYDTCAPDIRADSLVGTAASLGAIAAHEPRITIRPSAGSHPTHHMLSGAGGVGGGGSCPDAKQANSRLVARLAASFDVSQGGRPSPASLARKLRVSRSPYVLLHGYWNRSKAAAARAEAVAALSECSETGEGHDRRRLGATAAFPLIKRFEDDAYLLQIARHHLAKVVAKPKAGHSVNVKAQAGLTRAGEASGGGWHKDTISRGIKALLYLDDVHAANGPFAMLLDYEDGRLEWNRDAVSGVRRRLNESVVARATRGGQAHVRELHASMGTVVVFEISSAHRGKPCHGGERASLTNYYKVGKASTSCRAGQHVADGPFKRSSVSP